MVVKEEDVEKHIGGCMAGFFNIFDRPHLLSPKRYALPKRLSSKTEHSLASGNQSVYSTPELRSPALQEFKEEQVVVSSRRFSKEAPRLSLDSRAVVDAKGSLRPRPSVIARLMGLDALPSSQQHPLQRSASESRVISRSRFVDSFNFQKPDDEKSNRGGVEDPSRAPTPVPLRPKSFFPEPRQMMSRGSDLETLKQLLEALRLKGLLHSKPVPVKPIRSVASSSRRNQSKGKTSENSVKSPNRRPTLKESPQRTRNRTIEDHEEEMWKVDDAYGKTLLERCDKLLHSIAQMAASAGGDSQPSPVSVLDSSLYYDDSSPSPVMKRSLDFTQLELDGFISSSSHSEYIYISHILRASECLPQESDIFSLLEEKHQYLLKGKCASSAHERRLIFDSVQDIVGRLPPWRDADKTLQVAWSEFQKLRKKSSPPPEDVNLVCGVLRRDLSEDPWLDFQVEMSETVLDIERLVFKDLIGETIRHMAALNRSSLRRRLLF